MMAGWIYGLKGRDGTLKIGMTGRTPTERSAELGVAPRYRAYGPFQLAWKVAVPDMHRVEATVHRMLRDCRVSGELFQVDPLTALEVAEAAAAASRRRGLAGRLIWRMRGLWPRGLLLRLGAAAALLLLAAEYLAG